MRYAGLRISDAANLHDTQLVERASGRGSALRVFQKKTQECVYLPIPEFVAKELSELEVKGGASPLVFGPVKAMTVLHSVSPHTFRHTFSIAHLNAGTDLKFVSRWLGHKSVTITEKHYAHAVRGTMLASKDAYDAVMERQETMRKKAKSDRTGR
jgi:integrase